jgi:hypothetical protein
MNGRASAARTARRAKMTAAGLGGMTVVAFVAISGCSASGSSSSSILPSISVSGTVTTTVSPSSDPTPTVTTTTVTPTPDPTPTITATVITPTPVTPTPTTTVTVYPSVAPVTGGGGTAGLQDIALFGIGGAAILRGAGSLAYRRRVNRQR